jgi:MFS family permease
MSVWTPVRGALKPDRESNRPTRSVELAMTRSRAPADSPQTPSAVRAVAVATATQVCAVIPMLLLGGLAVQIRAALDFSPTRLGIAASTFLLARAVGSTWLGRYADRLGARRSMRLALTGSTISLIGIATLARDWWSLIGWLALGGAAQALSQPAVNRFLVRVIDPRRLGRAFGLKQSGPPLAAMLAGASVPLIGLTVGWRWAFVIAAAVALTTYALIPMSVRATRVGDMELSLETYGAGLRWIGTAFGLTFAGISSLTTFTVEAGVAAGIHPGTAGLLLSAGSLVAIAARLIAGIWADREGSDALLGGLVLLAIGVFGYPFIATQRPVLMFLGVVVATGFGWGVNGLFFLAVVRHNASRPGAATGIVAAGGAMGGVFGPPVFGAIVESAGYSLAWSITTAWALGGVICMAVGRRRILHYLASDDAALG